MSLAVKPLSNAPALDEPTNIEFTEDLPAYDREFSCKIVWRITTEIPSKHHSRTKQLVTPKYRRQSKTMMQIPNPKMAVNSFIPAFLTVHRQLLASSKDPL
jgi:hypothetical protein